MKPVQCIGLSGDKKIHRMHHLHNGDHFVCTYAASIFTSSTKRYLSATSKAGKNGNLDIPVKCLEIACVILVIVLVRFYCQYWHDFKFKIVGVPQFESLSYIAQCEWQQRCFGYCGWWRRSIRTGCDDKMNENCVVRLNVCYDITGINVNIKW